MDVSLFKKSIGTQDGKDDFDEFLAIVTEYIKSSSDSEINIDDRTRKEILKHSERSAYISLNTVRAQGGLQAARVSGMGVGHASLRIPSCLRGAHEALT